MGRYVVFTLDDISYAVCLSAVSRVVHAVEVTPLPKAPAIVIGVIDLGGRIIPVVDIRCRFRLPKREMELTDQLIIARTSLPADGGEEGRLLAFAVDAVTGVADLSPPDTTAAEAIASGLEHLAGVARTEQGLVLIHDLDAFLSLEEGTALDAALPEAGE